MVSQGTKDLDTKRRRTQEPRHRPGHNNPPIPLERWLNDELISVRANRDPLQSSSVTPYAQFEPAAFTVPGACHYSGLTRTYIYGHRDQFEWLKAGRRSLITRV